MNHGIRIAIILCLFSVMRGWASDSDAHKSKEAYVKKANAEVQSWTEKLKSLETRSEQKGAASREAVDRQLKHLDHNLAAIRKNIDELSQSQEGTWTHFRHNVDSAMQDLKDAFQKTEARFRENTSKKETSHEQKH